METLTDLFQDIKFRERFRGYDSTEVDAYVIAVAKAAAQLQGRLMELQQRAAAAESRLGGNDANGNGENGDAGPSPYQVLALAQRTADAAVDEARQEAGLIVEAAGRQAEQTLAEAADRAKTQLAQADSDARSRIQEAEYQCSLMRAEAEADRERMLEEARRGAIEAAEAERDRIMAEVNGLEATRIGLRAEVDTLQSCRSEHLSTLTGSMAALQTAIDGLAAASPLAAPPVAAWPTDAAGETPTAASTRHAGPVNEPAPSEPVSAGVLPEPLPAGGHRDWVGRSESALAGVLPESEPFDGDGTTIVDEPDASDADFDTSGISDLVPPAPPTRLVTATDIDMVAAGLNVLDRRQTSSSSALLDLDMAGPATQPMSAVADAADPDPTAADEPSSLSDDDPDNGLKDPDNGLLVEQLRQAVTEVDPLPGSDEAMVAFFGSDPGAQSRGWFRARR